jgi:hypothetical protein
MLLDVPTPLLEGCYLEVARGRYRYTARVAWSDGSSAGIQVRELIDVSQFAAGAATRPPDAVYAKPTEARRALPASRFAKLVLLILGLAATVRAVARTRRQHITP